jgi:diacylglycerol kinase (ATP)
MSSKGTSGGLASLRIALAGLRHLLVSERSSRIHLVATLAVIAAGLAVDLALAEWRWIVLAISIVWLSEAFNTAVERLGDALTDQPHPEIGIAKDLAAAAVMFAVIAAAIICISVLAPHLDWSP